LRTFAALCVLCGKKAFKTINRKERQERKDHAKLNLALTQFSDGLDT
jgi:hypothetical protein